MHEWKRGVYAMLLVCSSLFHLQPKVCGNAMKNQIMKWKYTTLYKWTKKAHSLLLLLLFIPKSWCQATYCTMLWCGTDGWSACVSVYSFACFRTHAHPSNMYSHFALIDQNSNYMESLSGQSWAAAVCCAVSFLPDFTVELSILPRSLCFVYAFRSEQNPWLIFSCLFIVLLLIDAHAPPLANAAQHTTRF